MIIREELLGRLRKALSRSPIVMLVGPRQCGKTTLAKQLMSEGSGRYFDLEQHGTAEQLAEPALALQDLKGLIVLDEAQRQPILFPQLRVLADRSRKQARFLVLGSASPELARQASESLAGRVEIIEVRGFDSSEIPERAQANLWLRGSFPRSFLARSNEASLAWRNDFITTFLERDLGNLGFGISPVALRRFWRMLAHYHGQQWNADQMSTALGISASSARNYVDALEQTYMVRRLQPWFINTKKRLVKAPKVYLRDTGLLHAMEGIGTKDQLQTHPIIGASWEGFAVEEVLSAFKPREAWYYATHNGAELDLFFLHKGKRIGVEIKRTTAPTITRSMQVALEDLKLDKLYFVYPGTLRAKLAAKVEAVPLSQLREAL
ncbi:MAG: ATP-binding protein [Flavobacteriales bacterium]|jgi:predicted AAA+ superfamily ATPase|nr:ATP-binding protein [Flavobacteriales bacterium]MBK6753226.1 ATP-binding protein [Flavobacteriales bacterium]MBK7752586.1 ATP-binding protein [Flavobacteriales bacterium]MBK9076743.1 ATP-binding protein [Flavobacteriales bacterium]MBK9538157.1 ATP-binding protein [Flavobacteriales bacterium]